MMKVCIVGGGAGGWMAATALRKIAKVTLIDSSKISSIGVGESTTGIFDDFINKYFDTTKFVRESDAAMKYGVYYKNWGRKDYIHPFQRETAYERNNITRREFSKLLLGKDQDTHIHEIVNTEMWKFVRNNHVSLDPEEHPHSWHFNAGKFILFMKDEIEGDINYINETVIGSESVDGKIQHVITESDQKIEADYFIDCCGTHEVFGDEYIDLSSYLLCDKAVVYPLPYENKREQFHPYTIAKTMNHGWRWITPTWSRIGTGYVFSSRHASTDECIDELERDIGKKDLNVRVVDFQPRINKTPFKPNSFSIGMSQGFLEPLDAPGLSLTIRSINKIVDLLEKEGAKDFSEHNRYQNFDYYWWASFILSQYKFCHREDTLFWMDQKNVKCPFYEEILEMIFSDKIDFDYEMFLYTMAAKDVKLFDGDPQKILELNTPLMHHYDVIERCHQ